MKDATRPLTTETSIPGASGEANVDSTLLQPSEFHLPRRSVSADRCSSNKSVSRITQNSLPSPRSEVWLDRVVRNADSSYAKSLSHRFNVDILLAGAAPLSIMLIYLAASLLRAVALFLTPVMMLSPLYPLYKASWSTGMKFVISGVYTSLIMALNALGVVSFPLYFVFEAIPQIVTTTFYFMVFSPGLVLAAIALTLIHRFTA